MKGVYQSRRLARYYYSITTQLVNEWERSGNYVMDCKICVLVTQGAATATVQCELEISKVVNFMYTVKNDDLNCGH